MKGFSAVLLFALIGLTSSFLTNNDYQVWLSTGDESHKFSRQPSISSSSQSRGYSVWVNTNNRKQTIEGFGAAMTQASAYVIYHSPHRQQIMRDLFGASGLHMTYIRITMGASDMQAVAPPYTYDDLSNGIYNDYNMSYFSIAKDKDVIIPILKDALAINPNLNIMASPWSAPAWMKANNKLFGGAFKTDWNNQQALSNYFLKFVQAYQAEGIPIHSITIQNEPLLERNDYPTMTMDAKTQASFIRDHLGPLFRQDNIKTKVLIWDFNWDNPSYPETVLHTNNVKQYVGGVAWHGYSGRHDEPSKFHAKFPDVAQYLSEFSGGEWDHLGYGETLVWQTRNIFIGQCRNWVSAVMLWNIALDEHMGPKAGVGGCDVCHPIVSVPSNGADYTRTAEYYSMVHFSRFVQPGAVVLDTADFGWLDLRAVAFQNPDGDLVFVVHNPSSSKSATFTINMGHTHLNYDNLPPQSTVTFVQ